MGVYVVYSVCLVTRTPSDAHRPPPTSAHSGADLRAYIIICAIIHIVSLLPLPLLLPIHPLHPVTSSHTPHLSRRFTSWPLTPPPRSDSTVHNVRTPCRPLRTQQGGRVRGLKCLSCHTHTIRHPPAPVGPSHIRTRCYGSAC